VGEVGGLFARSGGAFQGFTETLAGSGGLAGRIAEAMENALALGGPAGQGAARAVAWSEQGIKNATAFFARLRTATGGARLGMLARLRKARFYPRFADGMYNSRVLEIKGPGDAFHGAQARDAIKMSGNKRPYVVSCQSCNLQCRGGCPVGPVKDA
jgi:hypothetical protein